MTVSPIQIEPTDSSSWVELRPVSPEELSSEEWIRVAELLKRVTATRPETDLVSTIEDIRNGDSQLWALSDETGYVEGVIVTQIVTFQSGYTIFLIQFAATNDTRIKWSNWREVLVHMEEIGKMFGCDALRVIGRKGWGKIMTGYTEVHRTFDKTIGEVN